MSPFIIPPPLGQPHSIFGGSTVCWLFSCFHNPPNSDMDYRIFTGVRTWSFVRVRIHTGGLGTPTASQHNPIDSVGKTESCVLYKNNNNALTGDRTQVPLSCNH